MKQVKEAGYNKDASLEQFIRDLNEAGGNFTPNNLPAEMPVFWKKEGEQPYTLGDLGGEMGATLKDKLVDPVVDTATEIYKEGGLLKLV